MLLKKDNRQAPCINPTELAKLLTENFNLVMIDVRELSECQLCRIEGALHIPLAELKTKAHELNPAHVYVVYCKAGIRGNKGALILQDHGFKQVYNLTGGILQWGKEVDPSIQPY